jgi:hypothetical protein
MQGKIKTYKTKFDVEVGLQNQHDQTTADLTQMYNDRMIWGNTTLITDEGVNDETHRTIQSVNMETQEPETYQQELVLDVNAYIYNVLQYTDEEILAIIGD